jgi:transposase InsO family protein
MFSKYVILKPLRKATADNIRKHLEDDVFLKFGAPHTLLCDNGVQYKSNIVQQLCDEYGVKIMYNFYYHPQSNPTERVNRVIKTMIAAYVGDNHRHWDKNLTKINYAINSAEHEVTGCSPNKLVFGEEFFLNGTMRNVEIKGKEIPRLEDRRKHLENFERIKEIRREVTERLQHAYKRNAHYYNLRRRNVDIKPGQMVLRKNFVQSNAANYFSSKLAPKFLGPFVVDSKVGNKGFLLRNAEGQTDGPWHVKDLKLTN